MITQLNRWLKSHRTKRHIDMLAYNYASNPHWRREYHEEAVAIGMPVVRRISERANGANDVFDLGGINGSRIIELLMAIDTDYDEVVALFSPAETPIAKAILLTYQLGKQKNPDPADLFAYTVEYTRQNPPDEYYDSDLVTDVGSHVLKSLVLVPLLTPVLSARPGDPVAQEVACAWISEFPNKGFVEVLSHCVLDRTFPHVQKAMKALQKLDATRPLRCSNRLLESERAEPIRTRPISSSEDD